MEKEFVPYEQALELKQLGFNQQCIASYNYEDLDIREFIGNEEYLLLAPTFSQAFRFFRENYQLFISLDHKTAKGWFFRVLIDNSDWIGGFITYEEAELTCLKQLIEIVKTKQL